MVESTSDLAKLGRRRRDLQQRIAEIGDMRLGSLVGRFRKCGKANCRCAQPDDPGHGPSWSLTRRVKGETKTTIIPAGETVERTQRQIAERRRFQELARQLMEVSDQICQAQLEAPRAGSEEAAEKGGSKKRSGRR